MKYKLSLYFSIIILLSISCNNKPNELINVVNDTVLVQKSIENISSISKPDSLKYFDKQKDEKLQLLLPDKSLPELIKKKGIVSQKPSDINISEFELDSIEKLQVDADTQLYYGELYFAQGDNLKAVDYYENAMRIYKEIGGGQSFMEIGILLSNVFIELENYSEAIKTIQYANDIKDSLINVDNKTIIVDMESKYQLNEKNSTIEILQLKEDLNDKKIKAQFVFIGLLIIVFMLFVLTYYFGVQRNKLKEKQLRLELQNYVFRIDELHPAVNTQGDYSKLTEEKLKQFELSDRESEVLKFIAQGYKNSEIADKLFVSRNIIYTHIKNIYVKLDVKNRVDIV
jgi:DNA-binding CsgD family transcriptional regulator